MDNTTRSLPISFITLLLLHPQCRKQTRYSIWLLGVWGFSIDEPTEDCLHFVSEAQPLETSKIALSVPALVRQVLNRIAAKSQQTKRDRAVDLPISDEHYFAKRNCQLKMLDESFQLVPASDQESTSIGLSAAAAAPTHEADSNGEDLSTASDSEVEDVGDVIAEIQVQFQRLDWPFVQAKAWIAEQFGGRSSWQLCDGELGLLLEKLRERL